MTETDGSNFFTEWKKNREERARRRGELERLKGSLNWREYLSELSGVPRAAPEDYVFSGTVKSENRIGSQKNSDGTFRVVSDFGHFGMEQRFSQLFPGAGPETFVVIELAGNKKDAERSAEVLSEMRAEGQSAKSIEDAAASYAKSDAAMRDMRNFLASEVLAPKGFVFSGPSKEYPFGFFYKKIADADEEFEIWNVADPLWKTVDSLESLDFMVRTDLEEVFWKDRAAELKTNEERGFVVSEWNSKKTGKVFDNIDFPEREPSTDETEFLLGEGFRQGYRDGGKTYFSKEKNERPDFLAETIRGLEKLSQGRKMDIDKEIDMNKEETFGQEGAVLNGGGAEPPLGTDVPFDEYVTFSETAADRGNSGGFEVGPFQHWSFESGQNGKKLDMVSFSSQTDTDAMTSFMSQRGYKKSRQATGKHPFGTFYAEYDAAKSDALDGELKAMRSETSEKSVSAAKSSEIASGGKKGTFAEWSYRNYSYISFSGENGAENMDAAAELMKARGYVRAAGKDGVPKTSKTNPNGWYFSNMKTTEDERRRDELISELARSGYSREINSKERGGQPAKTAAADSIEPEPEESCGIQVETWEFAGKAGKFCNAAVGSAEITESVKEFMTNSENGFRFSDKTSDKAPYGFFYRSVNTPEREAEAWGTIAELRDMVPEVWKRIEKERDNEKEARKDASEKSAERPAAGTDAEPSAKTNAEKGNKTMSFDYQEFTDTDGRRWGNVYLHGKATDAVAKRLKSLGMINCGMNSRGNHQFGKIIEQDYQQNQMQEALSYLRAYQRPEGLNMPEAPVLGSAEPENRDASARPAVSAKLCSFYSQQQNRSYLNVYFDRDPGAEAKQAMANCGLTFNGRTRPRWWSRDVADTPELRESVDKTLGELGIARQYQLTPAVGRGAENSASQTASQTGGVRFNHEVTVLENGANASFFVFSERPGGAVTAQLKSAGYTFVAARTAKDGSFIPSCWHKSGISKETAAELETKFAQTMEKASGDEVTKAQLTAKTAEKQQLQRKNTIGRNR